MGDRATPTRAPSEPSPKHPSSFWILDGWRDVLLFVGTPLLIIPAFRAASLRMSLEDLALYVMAFGALGHHLPGMMRAYGDRALFRRFRVRFVLAPLFLALVCVSFTLWDLSAVILATYLWGVWHGQMQTYGFVRIYDAKAGSFAARTAKLDFWMCLMWFAAGTILSDTRLFRLLDLYHIRCGGPLPAPELIAGFQAAWAAATAVVTALFAWNAIASWRAGQPPSPVKLALMATSFGFWWYSCVSVKNLIVGLALFEVFHDVQYLSIVWVFNRGRVAKDRTLGGFTRFLFRRSGMLIGVYVGMVFAYGSLHLVAKGLPEAGIRSALEGLLIGSALLHFYYDGFIWKVREKSTRASLGLEGGRADTTGAVFRLPPWLGHGLKWGLFAVPVGLLGWMEPAARPSIFARTEALAAALPDNPLVQKRLGMALEEANRDEEAIAAYRRAVELGIDSAATEYSLGALLARQGVTDEALAHLEASLTGRETGAAHAKIAGIRLARGETEAAIRGFRTALELEPTLAEAHHGLGRALTVQGDLDGAVTHYRAAIRFDPGSAASRFNLAAILSRRGRTAEAIELYREVLRLDPEVSAAREELARLGATGSLAPEPPPTR